MPTSFRSQSKHQRLSTSIQQRKVLDAVSGNTLPLTALVKPSSKQPPGPASKSAQFDNRRIRATDPAELALLWADVRTQKTRSMPPKPPRRPTPAQNDPPQSLPSRLSQRGPKSPNLDEALSPPQSIASAELHAESVPSPSPTIQTRATSTHKKLATPRDTSFRQDVLIPRGVTIDATSRSKPNASFHFRPDEGDINYKAMSGLEDVSIWLDTGRDFQEKIYRRYRYMVARSMCEAQFAAYAKENLLRGEPCGEDNYEVAPEDRKWRVERLLEPVTKPAPDTSWQPPPLLGDHENTPYKDYVFDIRPDCSYWLSLEAFNQEYRAHVEEYVKVMYEDFTCPYFTVEFKKDGLEQTVAENQVAAAGTLALYNRYRLKAMRVSLRDKPQWGPNDLRDLEHYGLTFIGSQYTVWQLLPTLEDGQWKGCTMRRIFQSRCNFKEGVRPLIHWLNEIHFWGLRKYGPACERDIKKCLGSEGHRVSSGRGDDMDDVIEDSGGDGG
jgi:hypothetical protein